MTVEKVMHTSNVER